MGITIALCMIAFGVGMRLGQIRATNADMKAHVAYMQMLVDDAYTARDKAIKLYHRSVEEAEKWYQKHEELQAKKKTTNRKK